MTQKLSMGRGLVTEATVTEFVDEVVQPMLAELRADARYVTLDDYANSDEWWFDLNKLLQGKVLAPKGEKPRQQTPSEQSAHRTVFSGAVGTRFPKSHRLAVLRWEEATREAVARGEVPALPAPTPPPEHHLLDRIIPLVKVIVASAEITDAQFDVLNQLDLSIWDCDHFFLLPVALVLPRKTGPPPEWAALCRSDKMRIYSTDDGWMDEKTKAGGETRTHAATRSRRNQLRGAHS